MQKRKGWLWPFLVGVCVTSTIAIALFLTLGPIVYRQIPPTKSYQEAVPCDGDLSSGTWGMNVPPDHKYELGEGICTYYMSNVPGMNTADYRYIPLTLEVSKKGNMTIIRYMGKNVMYVHSQSEVVAAAYGEFPAGSAAQVAIEFSNPTQKKEDYITFVE